MHHKLQANIWKYTVHLITNKRAYYSILGVYLLTLPGAKPHWIGLMLLVGSLMGVFLEVPSGYLSDKIGHKNALVISRLALVASTSSFLIGNDLIFFILGAVFMNVAFAFESGTGTAFMHETLRDLGKEKQYSKIMGKVSAISFAVAIIPIVALPFLTTISFKAPFVVALLIDLVGLAVTMSLIQPPKSRLEVEEIGAKNFRQVLNEGRRLGIFKYLFFSGTIIGAAIAVASFRDAYQASLGVPIFLYGIFWGISRVIISLALLANDKIRRALSLHQFLWLKLILAAGLFSSLGLIKSPTGAVTILVLISAFGFSLREAQAHYYLDIIRDSKFKATLLSVEGLIQALVTAGVGLLLGLGVTGLGYSASFFWVGATLFIALALFYFFAIAKPDPEGEARQQ